MDLLKDDSHPTFSSIPPPTPFAADSTVPTILPQPTFSTEISPKLLYSISDPFTFTDERGHPFAVMEEAC